MKGKNILIQMDLVMLDGDKKERVSSSSSRQLQGST